MKVTSNWYCAWEGAKRDFLRAAQQAADTTGQAQAVHTHSKFWCYRVEVADEDGSVKKVVSEDRGRLMACCTAGALACQVVRPGPRAKALNLEQKEC